MLKDGVHTHVLGTALILIVLGGCASAPTQEMSDARRAISSARATDGVPHVAPTLSRVDALIKAAGSAMEEGHYEEARRYAIEAKSLAVWAREASREIAAAQVLIQPLSRDSAQGIRARSLLERAIQAANRGDSDSAGLAREAASVAREGI